MFGWSLQGDPLYDVARVNGRDVAALFPMPSRLADMNMPSFWMSYVHVEDVEETVKRAKSHHGVVIEVEQQAFNENAQAALVRDPSGAGFTLYQGPEIPSATEGHGTVQRRYHHVDDIAQIREFYADLFGWTFVPSTGQAWPTFDVRNPDGSIVARVEEVPERIRGTFKYWMPCFDVTSLNAFGELIMKNGGKVLSELPDNRSMFVDRQGAHFMARAEASNPTPQPETQLHSASPKPSPIPWKAILGLLCVWLAVLFDVPAFWGLLFLIWTLPALKSGRADFIEPVGRDRQPVMYWAMITTWIVLSLWLIAITIEGFLPG